MKKTNKQKSKCKCSCIFLISTGLILCCDLMYSTVLNVCEVDSNIKVSIYLFLYFEKCCETYLT